MIDTERIDNLEKRADAHDQRVGLLATRMTDVEKGNDRADHLLVEHEQRLKGVEASEPVAVAKNVIAKVKPYLPIAGHLLGYLGTALLCLTIGQGGCNGPTPVPPEPTPAPTPKPTPAPTPAPIPGPGLSVLVVYDSAQLSTLGKGQVAALYSQAIRNYVRAKGSARFLDKDADTTKDAQAWQDAMKRPRQSLPWIVVSNGTAGFEGPLPATEADTLALLKKFGG